MGTVYVIVDAEPTNPDEQLALHEVWLGTWHGGLVGVITDPPSPDSLPPTTSVLLRLHHVATIQKCLARAELLRVTGLAARDVEEVMDEVWDREFGTAEVVVDGSPVPVDTLSYRGLVFAFTRDAVEAPFTVLRRSGALGAWPRLTRQRVGEPGDL